VLGDAPLGHALPMAAYDYLLLEAPVVIFGTSALARRARRGFPRSLSGMPFLLPTSNTSLRRALDAWFFSRSIVPDVIGEIEDGALMAAFAAEGAGLFAGPELLAADLPALQAVGRAEPLRERYHAVTTERRIGHAAIAAIVGSAKRGWKPPKTGGVAATQTLR
jgi:LysR family transcriptional regulator, transcriptional activator of nhaA